MTINITNGDCLELMKNLPDKSVDLFICDLPYGETNCKWDCVIDLEEFWKEFKRLRKSKKTACIHFCSTKFGYTLIKSNEKMFKMDMVWKKRNKTGGLQSRHRPMRNHEMVYFFFEQAPKYNRDKYHKRIQQHKEPYVKSDEVGIGKTKKAEMNAKHFEPPNPASVLEEEDTMFGETKDERKKRYKKNGTGAMKPPNPASVLEEDDRINENNKSSVGWDIKYMDKPRVAHFDPKLPLSILEEEPEPVVEKTPKKLRDTTFSTRSKEGKDIFGNYDTKVKPFSYEPPNPASVVEEPEPVSMFESTKVFIGKRHHQTEKPIDILEFFLKYWSDEGDTILDPTMGSGSTGVACKRLKRNFIGFEMDEKIFKVAEDRINKVPTII